MRSALVRSGSYYYHPEVVVAACVPVGDTGAMRLAAAAAAAAAAVVAACVPERGTEEKGLVLLTPPTHVLSSSSRSAAVFWLGYQNWCGHLGASLDRDFASPGLLGVRWDGPAGGTTFRDPVAEPRPGSRSRAYVSSAGPAGGENFPGTEPKSLCCCSSVCRGLLEITTNAASSCSPSAMDASAASRPGHRLLW